MSATLDAVVPIFLLVAFGYLLARTGLLDGRIGGALSNFAGRVGIPILIFQTVLHADFTVISPWTLWACYFPAAAVVWTLGHLVTSKLAKRDERTSVIGGVGATFANTAFVGLPLAERVYGSHGVVIVTMLIAVHMPVMMTAATLLMERADRHAGRAAATSPFGLIGQILANLAVNPIVVAIVLATAWRLTGVPLPSMVEPAVASLARAAGPIALVALGMSLHLQKLGPDVAPTLVISAIKLVVMPALVWAAALFAGLEPQSLGPLVMLAGVPSGVNVHLIAVQYKVGQALAAGVVVVTTAVGVLTSTAWLIVLPHG